MTDNLRYLVGLGRAAGGAVVFALPLLMTMEMWELGAVMDRTRLLVLILVLLPTLVVLSFHAGFEPTFSWRDDLLDGVIAFGIGFSTSAMVLVLLGRITRETSLAAAMGMIALQTVPASIGAMLARTLLAGEHVDEERTGRRRYGGELFLMAIGALFLSFSIAPTEEVALIALRLTPGQCALLLVVSLVQMHAFVYAVEFRGQAARPEGATLGSEFLRLTVVGYAVGIAVSVFVLWVFARTDGAGVGALVRHAVVLGYPASLGAAAARLIL
jgi:putative integral membrane protein (TIGR02587 family)